MAISHPTEGQETPNLPHPYSIWPGVLAGLAVTFGLVVLELLGRTPRSLIASIGGVMTLAHGMVAFAVVTLLGEILSIACSERTLVERRRRLSRHHFNHPFLDETVDPQTFGVEVEQNVKALTEPWRETRRISQIVAYVVPLIGFAVATSSATDCWKIGGRPLLLAVGESFFVILLTMGVSNSLEVVKSGWLLIAPKAIAKAPSDDSFEEVMEIPQ